MKKILFTAFSLLLCLTAWAQQKQTMDNSKTAPKAQGTVVDITTSLGDIKVLLYDDTPAHRDNFLKLVSEGYYNGVLFHRVIKDFMVQTGDPDSKTAQPGKMLGTGDPGYTLEAEILYPKHYHKYGALAAARTSDAVNPQKRSSGSQFYIVTGRKYSPAQAENMAMQKAQAPRMNYFRQLAAKHEEEIRAMQAAGDNEGLRKLQDQLIKETEAAVPAAAPDPKMIEDYSTIGGTPNLDNEYTVFGEVIKGMDVVEKIQNAATDRNDRPTEDIKIISMKVEK